MRSSAKLLLVTVAVVASTLAIAQDAKQTADKLYAKFIHYAMAQNMDGISKMLDSSYTLTDTEGKVMGRAACLAQMTEMCKSAKDMSGSIVVDQATQHGDEIIAWVTMNAKMKTRQNGKWVTTEFTEKFVETMKKTPEGWKFISTIVLP